jgi:LytS/YehU family sensor histidine kinase
MVVKLSALLRFMLYEGSQPVVPLEQELLSMQHYVALEKLRYGSKLKIELQIDGTIRGQEVVPLMLLPFFENAFKHGPSQTHQACTIRGRIRVEADWLSLELKNDKLATETWEASRPEGIGLKNVRQRLKHHYGKRHTLKMTDRPKEFIVHLKIPLS